LGLSLVFKSQELAYFLSLVRKILVGRRLTPIPAKETEPVAPNPTDTTTP